MDGGQGKRKGLRISEPRTQIRSHNGGGDVLCLRNRAKRPKEWIGGVDEENLVENAGEKVSTSRVT